MSKAKSYGLLIHDRESNLERYGKIASKTKCNLEMLYSGESYKDRSGTHTVPPGFVYLLIIGDFRAFFREVLRK